MHHDAVLFTTSPKEAHVHDACTRKRPSPECPCSRVACGGLDRRSAHTLRCHVEAVQPPSEPQDESPGAGGSAGSDVASGSAGDGSPSGTGGSEQASDGGLAGATGGNGGAANGGGAGGSAKGGSSGAGGSGGAASSVPPCGTVVYDGEGAKTNLASGATFVWPDGGTLAEVTGEAHGGLHSMKVVFTPQGGWAWNWGHWVDKTRGVDASQATQLSFWLKASAAHTASGIVTDR